MTPTSQSNQNNLREIVFENLDNAKENGYFEEGEYLYEVNADVIAHDMIAFADDCEDATPEELKPYVEEWLNAKLRH